MLKLKYDTLLFDADGTLLDFDRCEREALIGALARFGKIPDEADVIDYSAINLMLWKMLERGEITKKDLKIKRFEIFCGRKQYDIAPETLAAAYIEELATKVYLIDGALELCKELSRYCRMYIITNGIKTVQDGRFSRTELKKCFREIFISEEMGCEKPKPEFFAEVARRVGGLNRATTLVIGDSLTSDIKGGIAAGFDTCWYNPHGDPVPDGMPITYTVNRLSDIITAIKINTPAEGICRL